MMTRRNNQRRMNAIHILTCYLLLLQSPYGSQGASQHRVRSSKRKVNYSNSFSNSKNDKERKFWIPLERRSRQLKKRYGKESRIVNKILEEIDNIGNQKLWSLHMDASLHSPEEVLITNDSRGKRKRRRTRLKEGNEKLPTKENVISKRNRRRYTTVENQFFDPETSPFVPIESNSSTEMLDDEVFLDDDEETVDTDGFNVTTEVEYENEVVQNNSAFYNATNQTNASSTVVYTTGTPEKEEFSDTPYQPIRIRAVLSEVSGGGHFLSFEERQTLFQGILSPGLLAWSAALRVNPVVGNLTVDVEQLYDGVTCGPGLESDSPSVPVPPLHLTEGIPSTDMIVYLSLGFVNSIADKMVGDRSSPVGPWAGLIKSRSTNNYLHNTSDISEVNCTEYWNAMYLNSNMTENQTPGSTTKNDTSWDSIYESLCPHPNSTANEANETSTGPRPTCSDEYLAAASYCSTDQYDRPTAAILHLCIDEHFFEESYMERNIITVMHELGHALGFNARSMAYFRNQDGSPITPRDKNGDIIETEVECTGPVGKRGRANVTLPSKDILQFRDVRKGVRVAEIVTPSVRQVVRNHFDCEDLPGAELESGFPIKENSTDPDEVESSSSCIGEHWERRLFRTDLLNPLVDEVPFSLRISPLTLAYFADSGWYQVDLSRAKFATGWGRGQGCPFVNDTCIEETGLVNPRNERFFCNDVISNQMRGTINEIHGCSPDGSRKAVCSINSYATSLPPEYQYFNGSYGPNIGGSEPFIDFCPVFTGFANGLCSVEDNNALLKVNSVEEFGYKNSRCVHAIVDHRKTALCMPIACVIEDRSLRVRIDGKWETCSFGGQILEIPKSGNLVDCPDPRETCPTFFCRRDCLGSGGICNYTTGDCMCNFTISNMNRTKSETVTGKCGNEFTQDQVVQQVFYDDLAHTGSELSDYYFDIEDNLDEPRDILSEDRRFDVKTIIITACVSFGFAVLLVSLFVWSFRRGISSHLCGKIDPTWSGGTSEHPGNSHNDNDNNHGQQRPSASRRRNKDKMVATVLVDLRVHDPSSFIESIIINDFSESERDSYAESITETETSGQQTQTSQSVSTDFNCDKSSDSGDQHSTNNNNDRDDSLNNGTTPSFELETDANVLPTTTITSGTVRRRFRWHRY